MPFLTIYIFISSSTHSCVPPSWWAEKWSYQPCRKDLRPQAQVFPRKEDSMPSSLCSKVSVDFSRNWGCLLYFPWLVKFILWLSFSNLNLPVKEKKKGLKNSNSASSSLELCPLLTAHKIKCIQHFWGRKRPSALLRAGIYMVPVTAWSCDAEQSDKQSQDWGSRGEGPKGHCWSPFQGCRGVCRVAEHPPT